MVLGKNFHKHALLLSIHGTRAIGLAMSENHRMRVSTGAGVRPVAQSMAVLLSHINVSMTLTRTTPMMVRRMAVRWKPSVMCQRYFM